MDFWGKDKRILIFSCDITLPTLDIESGGSGWWIQEGTEIRSKGYAASSHFTKIVLLLWDRNCYFCITDEIRGTERKIHLPAVIQPPRRDWMQAVRLQSLSGAACLAVHS